MTPSSQSPRDSTSLQHRLCGGYTALCLSHWPHTRQRLAALQRALRKGTLDASFSLPGQCAQQAGRKHPSYSSALPGSPVAIVKLKAAPKTQADAGLLSVDEQTRHVVPHVVCRAPDAVSSERRH